MKTTTVCPAYRAQTVGIGPTDWLNNLALASSAKKQNTAPIIHKIARVVSLSVKRFVTEGGSDTITTLAMRVG
jgi:hypothetical protein